MVFIKKEWDKKYRAENKEKVNAYFREYYKKNRLKHLALVNKWKTTENYKIYLEKKNTPEEKEKRRIYLNEWRNKKREHLREYKKNWYNNKLKAIQESHEIVQSSEL